MGYFENVPERISIILVPFIIAFSILLFDYWNVVNTPLCQESYPYNISACVTNPVIFFSVITLFVIVAVVATSREGITGIVKALGFELPERKKWLAPVLFAFGAMFSTVLYFFVIKPSAIIAGTNWTLFKTAVPFFLPFATVLGWYSTALNAWVGFGEEILVIWFWKGITNKLVKKGFNPNTSMTISYFISRFGLWMPLHIVSYVFILGVDTILPFIVGGVLGISFTMMDYILQPLVDEDFIMDLKKHFIWVPAGAHFMINILLDLGLKLTPIFSLSGGIALPEGMILGTSSLIGMLIIIIGGYIWVKLKR
ncbi:MAG: hypothetical protein ACE5J4_02335 [Candidatus Aenigmatarchaeota archaeon]